MEKNQLLFHPSTLDRSELHIDVTPVFYLQEQRDTMATIRDIHSQGSLCCPKPNQPRCYYSVSFSDRAALLQMPAQPQLLNLHSSESFQDAEMFQSTLQNTLGDRPCLLFTCFKFFVSQLQIFPLLVTSQPVTSVLHILSLQY